MGPHDCGNNETVLRENTRITMLKTMLNFVSETR